MYVITYIYVCVCKYVCIYVRMYVRTYIHTHMYIYIYTVRFAEVVTVFCFCYGANGSFARQVKVSYCCVAYSGPKPLNHSALKP